MGLKLRNGLNVKFLGHRGEGATDSAFSRERDLRERRLRLPENTVGSQRRCLLDGANGFELDAIQTADGNCVCTHADEVAQHILVDYEPPEKYIGRMKLYQIREVPVGPCGAGRIALLEDTLNMVKHEFPGATVNIELKGKIGNFEDDVKTEFSLALLVLAAMERAKFPLEDVIFSSFSHRYLLDMAELEPNAKLGMLYESPEYDGHHLYAGAESGPQDRAHAFSVDALNTTLHLIPTIYSIHPEVAQVTEETVRWVAERNRQLICWGSREESPTSEMGASYKKAILRVVEWASKERLQELTFITDHVTAMRSLINEHYGVV